jgi:hypothetical protein
MSWNKEYVIESRNKKLKLEENHWIIEKIETVSLSDILTDLSLLQNQLEYWSHHYYDYDEVVLDSHYNRYKDNTEYFLVGIRIESKEEMDARVASFKSKELEGQKQEQIKNQQLKEKKIAQLKKLKEELGEN